MRAILRNTCLVLLLIGAGAAMPADSQPRFQKPQITSDQWKEYLEEILAIPGIEKKESARQLTLTDPKTTTIYAFTQPANAAHPSVIVRALVKGPDGYYIHRVGYHVGDQAIFDKWWHEFDALDARVRRDLAQ